MKAKEEGGIKRETLKKQQRTPTKTSQITTMTHGEQKSATADDYEQQQQRTHLPLSCTQPPRWTMQHGGRRRPQMEATAPR